MKTIVIVVIILLSAAFRHGGAENVDLTEDTKPTQNRRVNLGIFIVHDERFDFFYQKGRVNIPKNEYFSLIVQMVQKTHFRNVTCTNISLTFMGSSKLDESYNVENLTKDEYLDLQSTLANFRNYSSLHSEQFGHPQLTVLLTGYYTKNNSELCRRRDNNDPQYAAYCGQGAGGAYFKGMCGNDSVVIATDDGRHWHGVTSLARGIATLMGVGSHVERNESQCPNETDYFTSTGWSVSYAIRHPDLSSCAKEELTAYIDSMSNSSNICWKGNPTKSILPNNYKPEDLYESVDTCSWNIMRGQKCEGTKPSDEPKDVCSKNCCDRSGGRLGFAVFPPGKSCGNDGVCFNRKCFE